METNTEILFRELTKATKAILQEYEKKPQQLNEKENAIIINIQNIIKNTKLSDFDAIEEIVCLFEKYGIDAGSRHDFG